MPMILYTKDEVQELKDELNHLRSRSASMERQLKDEYDRGYAAGRQAGYRYNVKEKRANAAHRRLDKLEQRVEDIEDMMG